MKCLLFEPRSVPTGMPSVHFETFTQNFLLSSYFNQHSRLVLWGKNQKLLALTEDVFFSLSQEDPESSKFGELSSGLCPGSGGVAVSLGCRLEKEEPIAPFSWGDMWSVACDSENLLLCCWLTGAGDWGEPKELWLSKGAACGATTFGVAGGISLSLVSAFISVLFLLCTSGTSEEVNSWNLVGDFSMGEKIVSSGTLQDMLDAGTDDSGIVLFVSVTFGAAFLLSDGFLLREGTRTILPLSFCSLSSVSTCFRRFISLCRTAALNILKSLSWIH